MTPDQYTLTETMIDVGDGHQLYAQLWGNPAATETIVFLHGGPGSGCNDRQKTNFDPARHRVIFFDQRGCGKSTPAGSVQHNDTAALVNDINKVTAAFDVDAFSITGGSWGSCLALVYAIQNPTRVTRMVLRGIFTGRASEIDFMDKGGFKAIYPEVWADFVASAPPEFAEAPGEYHLPRLLGSDPVVAKVSAFAYWQMEGAIISLDDRSSPSDFETFDPNGTIIECHYMANRCFLEESYILNNAANLTMPISLIQGRYDLVCPPITAYELAQKLPNAQLFWTVAGHSGSDRANWEVTRALL